MQIKIQTTDRKGAHALSENPPKGVSVINEYVQKDFSSAINLSINIDVAEILNSKAVYSWLIYCLGKSGAKIYFNGKHASIDQPDIEKLIEEAISQNKP